MYTVNTSESIVAVIQQLTINNNHYTAHKMCLDRPFMSGIIFVDRRNPAISFSWIIFMLNKVRIFIDKLYLRKLQNFSTAKISIHTS